VFPYPCIFGELGKEASNPELRIAAFACGIQCNRPSIGVRIVDLNSIDLVVSESFRNPPPHDSMNFIL
jgi:hypothetical protein